MAARRQKPRRHKIKNLNKLNQDPTTNDSFLIFLEVVSVITHNRQCLMGWAVRGSNRNVERNFCIHPDRLWGPPTLPYNGY